MSTDEEIIRLAYACLSLGIGIVCLCGVVILLQWQINDQRKKTYEFSKAIWKYVNRN